MKVLLNDETFVNVRLTPHAKDRMNERCISSSDILDFILGVGEKLLDAPASKRILIRDLKNQETVVCKFNLEYGLDLYILTVIDDLKPIGSECIGFNV